MVARLSMILALVGCNQIFGVNATGMLPPIDAQQFDAALDAPYACPPLGTAPAFSRNYHQAVMQNCTGYSASPGADLAMSVCQLGGANEVIADGPIDGAMTASVLVSPPETPMIGQPSPKIGPDGDVLLVRRFDTVKNKFLIALYERVSGTWVYRYDAYTPNQQFSAFPSTPTRGASARRFLLYVGIGQGQLDEIVETSSGVWSKAASHTTAELAVATITDVNLSPDGLRIVFNGATASPIAPAVLYADRARVGDPFDHAIALDVPAVHEPFMTEDCGRLYFDAIDTIFFVQQ